MSDHDDALGYSPTPHDADANADGATAILGAPIVSFPRPNAFYRVENTRKPPRSANCRERGRDLVERCDMSSIPLRSGIYQILCVPTGKVYIGSSADIRRRWRQHREGLTRRYGTSHENSYLQHAWDKYGADAFVFSVLEHVPVDQLLEREQHWIDHTRCYDRDRGFNRRLRAESDRGVKRTGQALENIRAALRGRPRPEHFFTPEAREAHRRAQLARRGRPFTDEHRQKLSEASKGKRMPPASRARQRQAMIDQFAALSADDRARRLMSKTSPREAWVCTAPDGTAYEVFNLTAFCQEHGLNRSCMGGVAHGRQAHHRGWLCRLR